MKCQDATRTRRIRAPHLEWDDYHEDLFVFIGKDMLNESPAGADERNGDEQECSFQAGKEKVSDTNGLFRLSLQVPPHSSFMTSHASWKRQGAKFRKHLISDPAHKQFTKHPTPS